MNFIDMAPPAGDVKLSGRHALVTGASRGIGAAVARALSARGARVSLLVRNHEAGSAIARELAGDCGVVVADVTSESQVAHAIQEAAAARGPVHILVNNAGYAHSAPFHRTTPAMFREMIDVHLMGAVYCMQAVLPHMISEQWGRIVNIASTAGVSGAAYVSAYSAAKHALVGLTRSVALEVAARGITVNAVCPGYTDTDLVADSIHRIMQKTNRTAQEAEAELLAHGQQQRLVGVSEVADAVVILCGSARASTTGETIVLDGREPA